MPRSAFASVVPTRGTGSSGSHPVEPGRAQGLDDRRVVGLSERAHHTLQPERPDDGHRRVDDFPVPPWRRRTSVPGFAVAVSLGHGSAGYGLAGALGAPLLQPVL